MPTEKEKLLKAKEILQRIANGVNPINGDKIEEDSFLHDPRIIRCFYFVSETLDKVAKGDFAKPVKFLITKEEKEKVELSEGKIGANEFARSINKVIDPNKSKKLTGAVLNKQLKKMGILGEEKVADGKTRTVLNENSFEYGIESEKREFNGNVYDMVLFNEKGKEFLLENLVKIMEC